MLEKKQYWITLLVAAIAFFILFIATYFIVTGRNKVAAPMAGQAAIEQKATSQVLVSNKMQIAKILPSTKVLLCLQTSSKENLESVTLNATSLLGLTEEELKERFKDCSIQTFNEDEVKLLKTVEADPVSLDKTGEAKIYTLGIDGDRVCIKEVATGAVIGHVDRKATDFSSYLYSLLLKESITITTIQKEALLKDGSVLQKILQDYVGE